MSNTPPLELPSPPPLSHNEALGRLRTCLHEPLNGPTWIWICALIQQLGHIALEYIQAHVTDRWPKQWLAMVEAFDGTLHSYNLSGVDFSGLHVDSLRLINCTLTGANFEGAHIGALSLEKTDASKLRARGLYTRLFADQSNLSHSDFTHAILLRAHLCNQTQLHAAKLAHTTFVEARLHNADLRGVDFSQSTFLHTPRRPFAWALVNQATQLPKDDSLDVSGTFPTQEPVDPSARISYLYERAQETPNARTWIEICALAHREDDTDFDHHVRKALASWPPEWSHTRGVIRENFPETFDRIDARGIDLERADVTHTNLRGANFYGANLSYADLSSTSTSGANLQHANLFRARTDESEDIPLY